MNFVEKLRLIADFFEAHPELETPLLPDMSCTYGKEQMLLAAKVPGATKKYDDTYCYVAIPLSGEVEMKFFTNRNNVCEPLMTEDVLVPAQEARITKKVIKWKCHPLLEPTPDAVLHI